MPSTILQQHSTYMRAALKQAERAARLDEVPVGAVIVDVAGTIIARGCNLTEKHATQCAHAELQALAKAGKKMGDWRLLGCWIYVTLQPCAMCMQAIVLHRLAGVVYGATSPLFGFDLDKEVADRLYKKDIICIVPGVMQEEASKLLKKFFKAKRLTHVT
jgi:tRNA(adenine34) deaminase